MGQARRNKAVQKEGFKTPDLIIFEPGVFGSVLFIELKAETIYKQDGYTLKANPHVEAQAATGKELAARAYGFFFAWDFDEAKEIIDAHLCHLRS
jgi:hypothetical protein